MTERIRIYITDISPIALQICLIAFLKRVSHTLEYVSSDPKPSWFCEACPTGTGPLMKIASNLDGSQYICQPAAMIEYLENNFPQPSIYPSTFHKNEVDGWVKFIRTEFEPVFMKVLMETAPDIQAEFRPKLQMAYEKIQKQLETRSTGPYFFETEYTIVDILLTPFVAWRPVMMYFRGFDGVDAEAKELKAYLYMIENKEEYTKIAYPLDKVIKNIRSKMSWLPPLSLYKLEIQFLRDYMQSLLGLAALEPPDIETISLRYSSLLSVVHYHIDSVDNILSKYLSNFPSPSQAYNISGLDIIPLLLSSKKEEALRKALEREFNMVEERLKWEESRVLALTEDLNEEDQKKIFLEIYTKHTAFYYLHLPLLLQSLSSIDRAQYVTNFASTLEENQWGSVANVIYHGVDKRVWSDLRECVSWVENIESVKEKSREEGTKVTYETKKMEMSEKPVKEDIKPMKEKKIRLRGWRGLAYFCCSCM